MPRNNCFAHERAGGKKNDVKITNSHLELFDLYLPKFIFEYSGKGAKGTKMLGVYSFFSLCYLSFFFFFSKVLRVPKGSLKIKYVL